MATRARALLDAHKHKTMATLRRDGSPRISGIEIEFTGDEVTIGMMPESMKLHDVQRDPRVAIHSPSLGATTDEDAKSQPRWKGDAKFSGTLEAIPLPGEDAVPGSYFRVNLSEVVLTHLSDDGKELVIQSWTPEHGLRSVNRT
ncbi:pyridoxamine 5'-phosphate oxidase family protein [Jatrophihabitans sp. GAS493]|uniref:pyridoxamine 5'-phosphate oxidase family protein n=1 Tax=Jatrophihabitans sp. GAS493 TaxID=1907575 RepID=UPI0018D58109|nr:pyridoxamine 5'-phosphate oxidase family protein [Jatrophihabitans sp. GAS493]